MRPSGQRLVFLVAAAAGLGLVLWVLRAANGEPRVEPQVTPRSEQVADSVQGAPGRGRSAARA